MINTKDIYFKIDSKIVNRGFWEKNIHEKKKLIDEELKQYIVLKLQEVGINNYLENNVLSVFELLNILNTKIDTKDKSSVFSNFVHYILNVSGSLQGFSIIWYEERDNNLKINPLIEINNEGFWDSLKTNKDTDYYQTFCFVYNVFTNQFLNIDSLSAENTINNNIK
jgi:hypothetical protein